MSRLWTVARQTFIEASRARLTVLLAAALLAVLVLVPVVARGEVLSDQIQAMLVYSIGASGLLISIWTILLGSQMVCGEIADRRIFTPLTKPVRRSVYVLGRWLGVVALQAILIAAVGAAVFATTYIMRARWPDEVARIMLDREVLCARVSHRPAQHGQTLEGLMAQRADKLKADGRYEEILAKRGPDALIQSLSDWAADQLKKRRTAPLFGTLRWRFTGLRRPAGRGQTVEFRFRADASREPPAGAPLAGLWKFTNPATQTYYVRPNPLFTAETFPIDLRTSFTLPAEVISEGGELQVAYTNVKPSDPRGTFPTTVTIGPDEMELLYPVGGFAGNFVRAMLLVWLLQMFLAAMTLAVATWLSFPVACLAGFVLLLTGHMASFILEATNLTPKATFWRQLSHYASRGWMLILPDFSIARPTQSLIDGLWISWSQVFTAASLLGVVWTGLCLTIAAVVLTRRELARLVAE